MVNGECRNSLETLKLDRRVNVPFQLVHLVRGKRNLKWPTAERRAATVLRTDEDVVLKCSLNLLDEPDVAAVAALRAKEAQLVSSQSEVLEYSCDAGHIKAIQ